MPYVLPARFGKGFLHPASIQPGNVVSVPWFLIRHFGIVTDHHDQHGLPTIISNSNAKHGVVEESWSEFGKQHTPRVEGYLGDLPPEEVIARARSTLGHPWRLNWNCEHFVFWCHGSRPRSHQLEAWTAFAGLVGVVSRLIR